jgi:catechol 2,3-dioxygenase-like lactoylglutathione lyase family enzyme
MRAAGGKDEPRHHFRKLDSEDSAAARFEAATPIFFVDAMSTSVDYYVVRLGFQVAWDWGDPPTFGCVKRGDVTLFLSERSQGAPGTWLFIGVDDVDRLYAEYSATGAKIVQAPADRPWGSREMIVEDPDGHRLRFATTPADGGAR